MPQDLVGFLLLSLAVMATPGPAVGHVIASTLLGGMRLATAAVAGLLLGHGVTVSLSLLAGTALLARPGLLAIGQSVAALVLLLLGLRLMRPRRHATASAARLAAALPAGRVGAAVGGFVMTLGNPISLAFVVSAAAGFLDPARPRLPQGLVLGAAYLSAAGTVYALYAVAAAAARDRVLGFVARRDGAMRLVAGAMMLAIAGVIGLRSMHLLEAATP